MLKAFPCFLKSPHKFSEGFLISRDVELSRGKGSDEEVNGSDFEGLAAVAGVGFGLSA